MVIYFLVYHCIGLLKQLVKTHVFFSQRLAKVVEGKTQISIKTVGQFQRIFSHNFFQSDQRPLKNFIAHFGEKLSYLPQCVDVKLTFSLKHLSYLAKFIIRRGQIMSNFSKMGDLLLTTNTWIKP